MITITRSAPCSVAVTGHSHSLVCAAVSALMLTLGANVAGMQAENLLKDWEISLKRGDSHVGCAPKEAIAPAAELMFDTVFQGFSLLSHLYPKHIELRVKS